MIWKSILAEHKTFEECLSHVAASVEDSEPPDLTFAFVSQAFSAHYGELLSGLRELLGGGHFLGCSASGLSGQGKETEFKAGLSLLCGWLPEVKCVPFHVHELPTPDDPPRAWRQLVRPEDAADCRGLILLADPFSLEPESLLRGLDFGFPECPKVGGLASGCNRPGEAALFWDDTIHHQGCLGVAFWGDIEIDTAVAQGCEPIGEQLVITSCRNNVLLELDGKPAATALLDTVQSLPAEQQSKAQRTVFVGLGAGKPTLRYEPGDFLVRQVMGIDPRSGVIAVAAQLRTGQTVQFHLRDADTSKSDIRAVLARASGKSAPQGGLLFSCVGRGAGLYGETSFDTRTFQGAMGDAPLSGFFCNGEIGPVGGESALHGFTSSFALFRKRSSVVGEE